MPRKDLKAKDRKNVTSPDALYNSLLVSNFINKMMQCGKRSKAEGIIYGAFERIKERGGEDPLATFNRALENVRPLLEVKARRVGGATYQVPCEVTPERGVSLAMRWILDYSRQKTGKPMNIKLADEILSASKKEGLAIKKREDTHKMAEANKAFAHYRW